MGDGKKGALKVAFDKRIKLEFHGAKITRDGGLLLSRELDESHRFNALAYVERKPVRAKMVDAAEDFEWSSAAAPRNTHGPSIR